MKLKDLFTAKFTDASNISSNTLQSHSNGDFEDIYGDPNILHNKRTNELISNDKKKFQAHHDSLDEHLKDAKMPVKQSFVSFVENGIQSKDDTLLNTTIDADGIMLRREYNGRPAGHRSGVANSNVDVMFSNKMDTLQKRERVIQKMRIPQVQHIEDRDETSDEQLDGGVNVRKDDSSRLIGNSRKRRMNLLYSKQISSLGQLVQKNNIQTTSYSSSELQNSPLLERRKNTTYNHSQQRINRNSGFIHPFEAFGPSEALSLFGNYLPPQENCPRNKTVEIFQRGSHKEAITSPELFHKDTKSLQSSTQLSNIQEMIEQNEDQIMGPRFRVPIKYRNTIASDEFETIPQDITKLGSLRTDFNSRQIYNTENMHLDSTKNRHSLNLRSETRKPTSHLQGSSHSSHSQRPPQSPRKNGLNPQAKPKVSLRERAKQQKSHFAKSRRQTNDYINGNQNNFDASVGSLQEIAHNTPTNLSSSNRTLSRRENGWTSIARRVNIKSLVRWFLQTFGRLLPRIWQIIRRLLSMNPYMQAIRYAQIDRNQHGQILWNNHSYQPWSNNHHSFE